MTPTARSLDYLRKRGAIAEVVENFIRVPPRAGERPKPFRRDLFGCLDIVAVEPGLSGCLGVQACITSDQSTRLEKIRQEPKARLWLEAGNRISVMGWSKRGGRGERKLWVPSITVVTMDMIGGEVRQVATA